MRKQTETALLAFGFDTELIQRIDENRDTLSSLRAKSDAALRRDYGSAEVQLIKDNIKRKPIESDVLDRVILAADGACCFCADGNSARPYQIHHIVEHAKTQDNSEYNLVLICPSHHQSVPRHFSVDEQEARRRSWQATVRVAKAYRARGLNYPYGLFATSDFGAEARPEEVIQHYKLSPATTLAVSRHELADKGVRQLESDKFLLIVGAPGDGKTTLAVGIGGLLTEKGFPSFSYHPPVMAGTLPTKDILTFLEAVDHECSLLLDDANLFLREPELSEIARAAGKPVLVIATWARESLSKTVRLDRHHFDSLLVSWERLQCSIRQFLIANEPAVVRALQIYDETLGHRRIGMGYLDTPLVRLIARYEKSATTSAEFFFLLRGGADVVTTEIEGLAKESRADIPILYAALEQIASFEQPVTPQQAAEATRLVETSERQPATGAWVETIFETQCERGRMQRERGAYTMIHRDWARRLIEAGCSSSETKNEIQMFLKLNLNLEDGEPMRTVRTWIWLWHEKFAGGFLRHTLAQATPAAWTLFVGRVIAAGFEAVGPATDMLHLLFRRPGWEETLANAFEAYERELSVLLDRATPDDVYALMSLSMAIGHASPTFAARVWESWLPAKVAEWIGRLHPSSYSEAGWMLAAIVKHSPEWAKEVGQLVRWEDIVRQLTGTRIGDIKAVAECRSLLAKLGVPIRRSMIRCFAEIMANALKDAHWADMRVDLHDYIYQLCFPREVERMISVLDLERLADEFSRSRAREWRIAMEFGHFVGPLGDKFFVDLLRKVDLDRLVAGVRNQAEGCEYELRLLIWLLSRADNSRCQEFSTALNAEIRAACRRSQSEGPPIIRAYWALDEVAASVLATELAIDSKSDKPETEDVWKYETIKVMQDRFAALDASEEDYVVEERANECYCD